MQPGDVPSVVKITRLFVKDSEESPQQREVPLYF